MLLLLFSNLIHSLIHRISPSISTILLDTSGALFGSGRGRGSTLFSPERTATQQCHFQCLCVDSASNYHLTLLSLLLLPVISMHNRWQNRTGEQHLHVGTTTTTTTTSGYKRAQTIPGYGGSNTLALAM